MSKAAGVLISTSSPGLPFTSFYQHLFELYRAERGFELGNLAVTQCS